MLRKLIIVSLLVALSVACASPTPTPTVTPTPTPLTVTQYAARVCGLVDVLEVLDVEDLIWGEALPRLQDAGGKFEQVNPPAELVDYHRAWARLFKSLVAIFESKDGWKEVNRWDSDVLEVLDRANSQSRDALENIDHGTRLLLLRCTFPRPTPTPTATPTPTGSGKPTIRLSDQQFESHWINNALVKFVVENGYEYPVETIEMTTPIMQATLASGEIHLNMELWQQNLIDWYNEETAAGNIINLGETYEGGPQFFVVPTYFAEEYGITSVEDMKKPEVVAALADPEERSKGAFINCIIGWQCAEINRAKFATYGLGRVLQHHLPGHRSGLGRRPSRTSGEGRACFRLLLGPNCPHGEVRLGGPGRARIHGIVLGRGHQRAR